MGKILINLEKLNTFGSESCPVCGKNFELGEAVVPASGAWEGERYIHEDEALYDKEEDAYYERKYYQQKFSFMYNPEARRRGHVLKMKG
ncbi:MAG: hypothetical protein ACOC6E_01735 [Thermodesulfobacteriota bacterium]